MPIEWVVDPVTGWMPGYSAWTNQLIRAVEEAMKARESEIEQWLKDNHIWMNRTGLAEASLTTKVFRDGLFIYVLMYYGESIFYSRFLEKFMHSGPPTRFSVLGPALDYWGPVLLADVKGLVE